MTNYNKRLDEILHDIIHIGYVQGFNQIAHEARFAPYNHIEPITIDEAKQSLRTLFQEAMDEVIADVGYSKTVNNYVALQRQRAKALLDEMFNAPR